MTEQELAKLARHTFAEVQQLIMQRAYNDAEAVIANALRVAVNQAGGQRSGGYA